jgi:hypothetical protein
MSSSEGNDQDRILPLGQPIDPTESDVWESVSVVAVDCPRPPNRVEMILVFFFPGWGLGFAGLLVCSGSQPQWSRL